MTSPWPVDRWKEVLPDAELFGDLSLLETVTDFFLDSRTPLAAAMFVPLKGERVDGHQFIVDLWDRGLKATFCARGQWDSLRPAFEARSGLVVVVVESVLGSLSEFAAAHLERFPSTLRIGVTGSNGKTTTKDLLAAALSAHGSTYSSAGNFNSEIGLPLMALRLTKGFQFAVFEMGINHKGEMDALATIVQPLLSVITNVGTAHIGIIGSQHEIALEKKKIFSRSGNVALAVLPTADSSLDVLREGFEGRVYLFGTSLPGYHLLEDRGLAGSTFEWKGTTYSTRLPGKHNRDNVLAALTALEALGLDPRKSRDALAAVEPSFGRSQFFKGRVDLYLDCYNANLDSMLGLLDLLKALPPGQRKVVVLGAMKELGPQTANFHRRLGEAASVLEVEALYFFGEEAQDAFQAAADSEFPGHLYWTSDFEQLQEALEDFILPGDLVVLKGSRGVALERLQDRLLNPKEAGNRVL
ncbi:MAG: UDP-N-acetylmuramoyl-tripeptide--D-alanyl-D-alanine ligase [Spirochaetales bacterium]